MATTLRFGLLMSIASAFGLNATAQSETFTGVSGTNYYVNSLLSTKNGRG